MESTGNKDLDVVLRLHEARKKERAKRWETSPRISGLRSSGLPDGCLLPRRPRPARDAATLREELGSMRTLLHCTVRLLKEQYYISDDDLARAIRETEEAS